LNKLEICVFLTRLETRHITIACNALQRAALVEMLLKAFPVKATRRFGRDVIVPQGWVVASDEIYEPAFVVRNLQPHTSYMFLVRARNSHGLSFPSPVTAVIRTQG